MIHINIALLLIAAAFVAGWLFEGVWLKIVGILRDAGELRALREQAKQQAEAIAAWDAQQKATTSDW